MEDEIAERLNAQEAAYDTEQENRFESATKYKSTTLSEKKFPIGRSEWSWIVSVIKDANGTVKVRVAKCKNGKPVQKINFKRLEEFDRLSGPIRQALVELPDYERAQYHSKTEKEVIV